MVAVVVTVVLGRGLVMAAKTASLAGVTLGARGGQLNDIINVDHKTEEAHALRCSSFSASAKDQARENSSDAGCTSSKEARMSIRWLGHSSRSSFSRRAIWVAAASYTAPTLASAPAWG